MKNPIDIQNLNKIELGSYLDSKIKESEKITKKNAINEWRDNYSFAKRSYPWKTYIRINSDGVFIGNKNQPFSNRVLDF